MKYRLWSLYVLGVTIHRVMATNSFIGTNTCKRLQSVEGSGGKRNDIVFCSSAAKEVSFSPKRHVIFFGGDVQNYPEEMENHRDNHRYAEWNLESTAKILATRFPDSHVFIVKPKEMFLTTFSIYSNFVSFSDDGIPAIGVPHGGFSHAVKLYNNARRQIINMNKESENGDYCTKDTCGDDIPISLVGFSKGCVVLNQLMYELDLNDPDMNNQKFIQNIDSVYWLDGGHIGDKNAWITDDEVLAKLVKLDYKLFAHVTPYQVKCSVRVWIGKEERKFVQKLKKLKANITETRHFFDEPGSIENHFAVLKLF